MLARVYSLTQCCYFLNVIFCMRIDICMFLWKSVSVEKLQFLKKNKIKKKREHLVLRTRVPKKKQKKSIQPFYTAGIQSLQIALSLAS